MFPKAPDCPFLSCLADTARLQHEVTEVHETWGMGKEASKASALGPLQGHDHFLLHWKEADGEGIRDDREVGSWVSSASFSLQNRGQL